MKKVIFTFFGVLLYATMGFAYPDVIIADYYDLTSADKTDIGNVRANHKASCYGMVETNKPLSLELVGYVGTGGQPRWTSAQSHYCVKANSSAVTSTQTEFIGSNFHTAIYYSLLGLMQTQAAATLGEGIFTPSFTAADALVTASKDCLLSQAVGTNNGHCTTLYGYDTTNPHSGIYLGSMETYRVETVVAWGNTYRPVLNAIAGALASSTHNRYMGIPFAFSGGYMSIIYNTALYNPDQKGVIFQGKAGSSDNDQLNFRSNFTSDTYANWDTSKMINLFNEMNTSWPVWAFSYIKLVDVHQADLTALKSFYGLSTTLSESSSGTYFITGKKSTALILDYQGVQFGADGWDPDSPPPTYYDGAQQIVGPVSVYPGGAPPAP